jgi:hypothetical protein
LGQQAFFSVATGLQHAHLSHLQSAFFSPAQPHASHLQEAFFSPCEGHCATAVDTNIATITAITLINVFIVLFLSQTLQKSEQSKASLLSLEY